MDDHVCEYVCTYVDTETRTAQEYSCARKCVGSGTFCMFHNANYFKHHKKQLGEEIQNELDRHDGLSINFMGCHIPTIKVTLRSKSIYFNDAVFHGKVRLAIPNSKVVNFTDAKFHEGFELFDSNIDALILQNIRFNVKIDQSKRLSVNRTNQNVEFHKCSFEEIQLNAAIIPRKVTFKKCTIKNSEFQACKFHGEFSIAECVFVNNADFTKSTFLAKSIFNLTRFNNIATFRSVVFDDLAEFHNTSFQKQDLVVFTGNLSKVSFLGTDITRIRFSVDVKWGGKDGYTIIDEENMHDDSSLNSILSVYRNLRENREFQMMYAEAGRFFIKEMELQRVFGSDDSGNVKKRGIRKFVSLKYVYKHMSGYGERPSKILPYGIALVSIATVLFVLLPDGSMPDLANQNSMKECLSSNVWHKVCIAFERTLGALFQTDGDGIIYYGVRAASLPILGMLFIALRRRYERRFRH